MSSRFCPICNEQCVVGDIDDGKLYCEKCIGYLTPEGLLHRGTEEVGRGGDVIWEYGKDQQKNVDPLVQKIAELESWCREAERVSPTPISLGIKRWNLNSAVRRLRRWMLENDTPLVIADSELRECSRRVLRRELDETDIDEDQWGLRWIVDEFASGENGHLDNVINYKRKKLLEPPIVLRHLPEIAGKALSEALEASRWGLPLATVALCRLVLEDAVHVAFEADCKSRGVTPMPRERSKREELSYLASCALERRDRQLRKLVEGLPEEILSPEEKKKVQKLLDDGNTAIHRGRAEDAGGTLFDTAEVLTPNGPSQSSRQKLAERKRRLGVLCLSVRPWRMASNLVRRGAEARRLWG